MDTYALIVTVPRLTDDEETAVLIISFVCANDILK